MTNVLDTPLLKLMCTKCKEWKLVAEFTPRKGRSRGYASNCHSCKRVSGAAFDQLVKPVIVERLVVGPGPLKGPNDD